MPRHSRLRTLAFSFLCLLTTVGAFAATAAEYRYVQPLLGVRAPGKVVRITEHQTNLVLSSYVAAPESPLTIIVEPGVVIRSTSTSSPALHTGAFPAGYQITLINKGAIIGRGGDGMSSSGSSGISGGDAISLSLPIVIDNSEGYILSGGGGGGRSGCGSTDSGCAAGGGGAGGGRAGDGGSYGDDGSPGTSGLTGTGGAGGYDSYRNAWGEHGETYRGGYGGGYGEPGANGTSSCFNTSTTRPCVLNRGYSGGAAGDAIQTNGHAVTWLGGNVPERVKGLVH